MLSRNTRTYCLTASCSSAAVVLRKRHARFRYGSAAMRALRPLLVPMKRPSASNAYICYDVHFARALLQQYSNTAMKSLLPPCGRRVAYTPGALVYTPTRRQIRPFTRGYTPAGV